MRLRHPVMRLMDDRDARYVAAYDDRFRAVYVYPDVESVDLDQADGTAYLASRRKRSGTMTRAHDEIRDDKKGKTQISTWLVAAAAVLVLGVVGLLTRPDKESPAADDPIFIAHEETIQQFISTRDYPTFASLVTENWLTENVDSGWFPGAPYVNVDATPWSTGEEMMQNAWATEDIIGVERFLVSCVPVGDIAADCTMSYTNDIWKAMDYAPLADGTTFIFVDGRINNWFEWGEDPRNRVSRDAAIALGLYDELLNVCPVGLGTVVTPACVQYIMDNLDAQVAWIATNR